MFVTDKKTNLLNSCFETFDAVVVVVVEAEKVSAESVRNDVCNVVPASVDACDIDACDIDCLSATDRSGWALPLLCSPVVVVVALEEEGAPPRRPVDALPARFLWRGPLSSFFSMLVSWLGSSLNLVHNRNCSLH